VLRVWIYHRAHEGTAPFGSYIDYFLAVPEQGEPILLEAEDVTPLVYQRAMHNAAENCLAQVAAFRRVPDPREIDDEELAEFCPTRFHQLRVDAFRNPVEAAVVILLSGHQALVEQVRPAIPALLGRYDYSKIAKSQTLVSAEWLYWLDRKLAIGNR